MVCSTLTKQGEIEEFFQLIITVKMGNIWQEEQGKAIGGGLFFAYEDFGRMFDHSFWACAFHIH